MAPQKFKPLPDLNTKHEELDEVSRTMDNILVSEDDFTKIERLPSGTVMTTRKQATLDEIDKAKAEKLRRRRESNLARGSADVDGSYEPGLELVSEPRHAFQAPASGTTRKDN